VSGITGYSQVNGKNKTTFRQMPEMDTYYSRNALLWLDVMILLGDNSCDHGAGDWVLDFVWTEGRSK